MLIVLIFWSTTLSFTWQTDRATSLIFLCFSTFVGGRFMMMRTVVDDQVLYYFYNVSLVFVFFLHCITKILLNMLLV